MNNEEHRTLVKILPPDFKLYDRNNQLRWDSNMDKFIGMIGVIKSDEPLTDLSEKNAWFVEDISAQFMGWWFYASHLQIVNASEADHGNLINIVSI
jgi:hypothetical protein